MVKYKTVTGLVVMYCVYIQYLLWDYHTEGGKHSWFNQRKHFTKKVDKFAENTKKIKEMGFKDWDDYDLKMKESVKEFDEWLKSGRTKKISNKLTLKAIQMYEKFEKFQMKI